MVFVKEGESFGIKLVKFVSMGLVSFKLGNVLKGIFIGILLKFDIRFKFGNVDILVVREVVLYGLFESKEEDRFRFFGVYVGVSRMGYLYAMINFLVNWFVK